MGIVIDGLMCVAEEQDFGRDARIEGLASEKISALSPARRRRMKARQVS